MEIPPSLAAYITDIQVQAIRAKGYPADPERYGYATVQMFGELVERNPMHVESVRLNVAATDLLLKQIGPFQNPDHLVGLVIHNREVLETARTLGLADDSWVPFASATFGSDNAATRRFRNDYVIIYNDGLLFLYEFMGHLLSSAMRSLFSGPGNESLVEGAQRTFHRGSRLGSAIIKTITSFVTTGDPRNVAVQVDDDLLTRDGVSLLFRDGMTRYVVAHELGHVYLRHLERDAVSAQQVLLRDPSGPWQDEYEADHFALRVVLDRIARSATEKPRESSLPALMAIEMGLMLRVFVEAAQGYLIGRTSPVPDGEGSHPPADRRFTRYRSAIDAQVGDSRALRQLDFQDAHAMVDLIVWHVLPPLREECLRLRLAGVRPV